MPEGVQPDPILDGTLRPKAAPIQEGSGPFVPFPCPDFQPQIHLPLSIDSRDAYTIFSLFFTNHILQVIVDSTNRNVKAPKEPKPHARAND
jgi:hypothetical protein